MFGVSRIPRDPSPSPDVPEVPTHMVAAIVSCIVLGVVEVMLSSSTVELEDIVDMFPAERDTGGFPKLSQYN